MLALHLLRTIMGTSYEFLILLSVLVNCDGLSDISNGDTIGYSPAVLSNGQYSIGTDATYSCTLGQLFNGDMTRTCLDTGLFDGAEPECLGE